MNKSIYYVYILVNAENSVLYIGMTNDIHRRLEEHREGINEGFSKKYRAHKLVFIETTNSPETAIEQEKQLKRWGRSKKDFLISRENPQWEDLSRSKGS